MTVRSVQGHIPAGNSDTETTSGAGEARPADSYNPAQILIIPSSESPHDLRRCLNSLVADSFAAKCDIWIADDCLEEGCIEDLVREFHTFLPGIHYLRRERRLGFIENFNALVATILPSGDDVLLLSPSAELRCGALAEMQAVLYAHEKHAVVCPRSNAGDIYSIPSGQYSDPSHACALWSEIKAHLPRFQIMPACGGACVLIRNAVFRMFGLFDNIYCNGVEAGHDFVCRINRLGYSAVAANYAFVSQMGTPGLQFEDGPALRDRAVLDSRYPEFGPALSQHARHYVQPVEHFCAAFQRRRQSILFDLSHLAAVHCGSSEFALSLLLRLAPLLEEKYDLRVLLTAQGAGFLGPELTGYQLIDADRMEDATIFDLVYKPAQVFSWREWYNMVRRGARLAYTHQDVIAVRCFSHSGPNIHTLFRTTAELVDLGITISEFSKQDFECLFDVNSRFVVIHHGAPEELGSRTAGEDILVMGNRYPHKALAHAVKALIGVGPVVVVGVGDPEGVEAVQGVRWISGGLLSRREMAEIYQAARVVVFPSVYEGFGLPVLEALAHGKPVVALDLAVNRELASIVQSPNFSLAPDFDGIRTVVQGIIEAGTQPVQPQHLRSWSDAAREYAQVFENLLSTPINIELLNRRWKLMQTLDAYHLFA